MKIFCLFTIIYISSNLIIVNGRDNSESGEEGDKSKPKAPKVPKAPKMSASFIVPGSSCFPTGFQMDLEGKKCLCKEDRKGKVNDFFFFKVAASKWKCQSKSEDDSSDSDNSSEHTKQSKNVSPRSWTSPKHNSHRRHRNATASDTKKPTTVPEFSFMDSLNPNKTLQNSSEEHLNSHN